MKDYLLQLVQGATSAPDARNAAREYLQARILERLQRSGAFSALAFQGGTALRFLFSLPRFSEDLDFALEHPEGEYDLRRWLPEIRSALEREGYNVTLKISDRRTVHSAFVGFPGLLFELGLSRRREQSLSVKLEIDTRPPSGAELAVTPVRRHVLLRLQHHDRASLFAGKLHALLSRPYAKGRDLFDLAWYLSDPEWPEPNLVLLNNALAQTKTSKLRVTRENWRSLLLKRLDAFDWPRLAADVRPFLEDPAAAAFVSREDLEALLKRNSP
ncbi:MAG: nucleotidyl transferase AbiEii/AbiGii toxin family protein [Acidobacteriota bacterium]|jgi:predicted nucleotidyltransferase component of viral defense system